MMPARRRLLIVSFSDIANDARVRKQVDLFAEDYDVTTCGLGAPCRPDVRHLPLANTRSKPRTAVEAILLRLRLYRLTLMLSPEGRAVKRALRGERFDVAIANDVDVLAATITAVGGERIHSDLHEYFPGLHDQILTWTRIRRPYLQWLLRRDMPKVRSVSVVSRTISERYQQEFGFESDVVQNATAYHELAPTPTDWPLRIVHSGGAHSNRRIEVMMEAVARTSADVTLDLYLTMQGTAYADGLRELADRLGERITIHPPVPYSELVDVLNSYDVGIFVLPPTNTNYSLALPNKFFDYVQARLGQVVSPTVDMAALTEEHHLGITTRGFEVEDVVAALDTLRPEQVAQWKQNADAAAGELSSATQDRVWKAAIERIAAPGTAG